MNKINVLQVNKFYHPHIGGVEKIVQYIAEGLSDRVNMQVLACQPHGKGSVMSVNGVRVVRAGSIGTYCSMPVSGSFPFLLRSLGVQTDIIHFHLPFPLGDMSYLFMRYPGKTVAWWHCDIVRQKNWLILYKPCLMNFLHKVDKIMVATSQHIESSEILHRFRDKCVIIPYGIDTKQFELTNEGKSRVFKIRNTYRSPIILFMGRLTYYKGVEYLIRAMPEVEGKLLIVGDGPLKSKWEKLTQDLKLNDKVFFIGKVPEEEKAAYFHSCDVFVLSSASNTEAFGLVQLEAMACGKPVINTALPTGVPIVSVDGKTGITVPPKDPKALAGAVNELLYNEKLRIFYGQNARMRVEKKFSRDLMLGRIYEVYQELFPGRQ